MDTKLAEFWVASHQKGRSYLGQVNEQAYYNQITRDTRWIEALIARGLSLAAMLHNRAAGRTVADNDLAASH